MPHTRASNKTLAFIDDYCKKHKLKNREQALDQIIERLQYLEDLALEQASQPSGMDKELGFAQPQTDLEYAQQHQCPYRTMLNNNVILCAEHKRIPLKACVTRQKRYKQFSRKCRPVGMEKPRFPQKQAWKQRADKEPKTRTYKGDEGAYLSDFDGYYRDDWGQPI